MSAKVVSTGRGSTFTTFTAYYNNKSKLNIKFDLTTKYLVFIFAD
jgi:hypothetical protein